MNNENFIQEITRHNRYEDVKKTLANIVAFYNEYQKYYDSDTYESIINALKELGYNDKEYNSKDWEDYARKCINFYNKLIINENKNKVKSKLRLPKIDNKLELNNKNEIIDNDINEIKDNQIIDQIMNNKDFVYLVIGNDKYKEIEEKLKTLDSQYQTYYNSNKSPENMRPIFKSLLSLGYNSKIHGDWEECAKKCSNFYKLLIDVAKENGIA